MSVSIRMEAEMNDPKDIPDTTHPDQKTAEGVGPDGLIDEERAEIDRVIEEERPFFDPEWSAEEQ
jgi:hypothetical protein